MSCLDENTVVALAEGTLSPVDRAAAEAHLDACGSCRVLVGEVARAFGQGHLTRLERTQRAVVSPSPPLASAAAGFAPGTLLGRYVLLHRLGEGGMGVVWAAYDPELNRNVAIKLLRRELDEPLEIARARLRREAQAMARLSHANVVSVFDLIEHGDAFYVAMELVEGTTLRQWLEERPRPWREVLAKFLLAGRGLAAAHDAGLIHRDFKPDNVFLGKNGSVRVGDFGLARELDATPSGGRPGEALAPGRLPRLTAAGAVAGTPAYMAPEQRAGLRDVRSDQFSFCACLFEALSGRHPYFDDPQDSVEIRRATELGPIRLGAGRPRFPARVLKALERGLAPRAQERFPTMDALLAALEADPARAWRRAAWVAGAAVVVVGGLLGLRGVLMHRRAGLCGGEVTRIAQTFTDADARRIAEAFHRSGLKSADAVWPALHASLLRDTQALQASAQQSCVATRLDFQQSEETYRRRARCLESARLRLGALVEALREADRTTVTNAGLAAELLPEVGSCINPEAGASTDKPSDASERAALERELDQVEARVALGHPEEASAQSTTLLARARVLRDRGLEAAALLLGARLADFDRSSSPFTLSVGRKAGVEGSASPCTVTAARMKQVPKGHPAKSDPSTPLRSAQGERGRGNLDHECEDAAALGYEAAFTAEAGRADRIAIEAWTFLVGELASQSRFTEAETAGRQAEAELSRFGEAPRLSARLELALGSPALAEQQPQRARQHLERAQELFQREDGPTAPALAEVRLALGRAYDALGSFAAASDVQKQALARIELDRGTDDPTFFSALAALTDSELAAGRWIEALADARRALQLRGTGVDPTARALDHYREGLSLLRLGRFDEAARALDAATARRAEKGTGDSSAPTTLPRLTPTQQARIDAARAETALRSGEAGLAARALTDCLTHADARAPAERTRCLLLLAQSRASRHQLRAALAPAREALALAEGARPPLEEEAFAARVALGRSELGLGDRHAAESDLKAVLASAAAAHVGPQILAEAQFLLARALVSASPEALARAREARDTLARAPLGGDPSLAREIADWIEAHASRGAPRAAPAGRPAPSAAQTEASATR